MWFCFQPSVSPVTELDEGLAEIQVMGPGRSSPGPPPFAGVGHTVQVGRAGAPELLTREPVALAALSRAPASKYQPQECSWASRLCDV